MTKFYSCPDWKSTQNLHNSSDTYKHENGDSNSAKEILIIIIRKCWGGKYKESIEDDDCDFEVEDDPCGYAIVPDCFEVVVFVCREDLLHYWLYSKLTIIIDHYEALCAYKESSS